MPVELNPITTADLPAVARFMHENLNASVSTDAWITALRVPWTVSAPNHGYFLSSDGEVAGAYLAYYSERTIDGKPVQFCNLGAWCVHDSHRAQGLRLLMSLLRQSGYHFTDFSPSGNVVPLNRKLGFIDLDTTTRLLVNLPWPTRGGARISSAPAEIESVLVGPERRIYEDHRATSAARHLLLLSGDESCYVVFRRDSRKGIRAFASMLYVGNKPLFQRMIRPVGSHLLLQHGVAATLLESRVVGEAPRGSIALTRSRPKMYKSDALTPDQIDYLYSELTCLEW
ncbi:GNAT family N-acetyltransferase [Microbacterium sp. HJ5]